MSVLKRAWVKKRTSSLLSNHVGALDFVMRQHCRNWPHGVDAGFPTRDPGHVVSLVSWVARASAAAARMSHGEIWWSDGDAFRWDVSLEQAFGQLRALEAMPEEIEPLFAEPGGRWSLEARTFARQAKDQLDHLRSRHLGFAEMVHLYIRVNAASATPPSFVTRLNAFQDRLKTRHGSCRCRWWLTGAGWLCNQTEEGRGEGMICPYDLALDELKHGWGRSDLGPSNREAEQERLRFGRVSHDMRDVGLIRYMKDAKVSPQGHLYFDQDIWVCCEWVRDAPLTAVFDMAVTWELDAAIDALIIWLDDIDHGVAPFARADPQYCVRLREMDDGLSLIKWGRAEGSGRRARPRSGCDVDHHRGGVA
ncbi:hypothetical protein SB861_52390 [Paraburkholderia sp. SIMBA_049]